MRTIAVLFTVGLLVGCGSADEPVGSGQPPASTADAGENAALQKSGCELLTDAEVGEATGTVVSDHEEAGFDGCRWRAQGGTSLMLDVYTGSTLAPTTCEAQKVLGTGREEAVTGLGDSALWKTSRSLVVCTTRAVIRFNLDNSSRTVPQDKASLITLAGLVLSRV